MAHIVHPLRLGFIGWGAINRRVAALLAERQGSNIALAAICRREPGKTSEVPDQVPILTEPSALAPLRLDVIVEAAGRAAVAQWGECALTHAGALAIASTSAFCDTLLLERLIKTAEKHGSQILMPSGALAGIDALAAAAALPLASVTHRIVKPPRAWVGTPAQELVPLEALTRAVTFFQGSARQAASHFPQNANVAVIAALSGIGLDKSHVELVADPYVTGNRHELVVRGDFGTLDLAIENRPLAGNPKSSDMAALSLVRLVENRVRAFVR